MNYRQFLIQSVIELQTMREVLFTQIVNLAMANELNEIDSTFEIGDAFYFDKKHFESMKDKNVELLLNTLKTVENTIESFININAINDEELNGFLERK